MGERHFTLSVQGFSHKMAPYVDDLLHTIVKYRVTPQRLKIVLETMRRKLQNFDSEEPYLQASLLRNIASIPDTFLPAELLEASRRVNLTSLVDSLQTEIQRMFKTGNLEMLIHGNANTATSQQLAKIVAGTFSPPDDASKCPRNPMRVREFPRGSNPKVFQYVVFERVSLFLIRLLRRLARVTYTTLTLLTLSYPSLAIIPREYSIKHQHSNTGTDHPMPRQSALRR